MLSAMPIVLFVYAAILVAGGAMGTIMSKTHEIYSVLGSFFFAAFAVWGAILLQNNRVSRTGLIIGMLDATVVAIFFAIRFAMSPTHKIFPALPSIGLSAVVIILSLIALASAGRATT